MLGGFEGAGLGILDFDGWLLSMAGRWGGKEGLWE